MRGFVDRCGSGSQERKECFESVTKGFASRARFVSDTFHQRSKVRAVVSEEYERIYSVFTINKTLLFVQYW